MELTKKTKQPILQQNETFHRKKNKKRQLLHSNNSTIKK